MRRVLFVLGCGLLLLAAPSARSDQCTDLQAAIEKANVLKAEMQREAGPFNSSGQIPAHNDAACNASQILRDHIVAVIRLIDPKCLDDEKHRALAANLNAVMRDANDNIGLFCN